MNMHDLTSPLEGATISNTHFTIIWKHTLHYHLYHLKHFPIIIISNTSLLSLWGFNNQTWAQKHHILTSQAHTNASSSWRFRPQSSQSGIKRVKRGSVSQRVCVCVCVFIWKRSPVDIWGALWGRSLAAGITAHASRPLSQIW